MMYKIGCMLIVRPIISVETPLAVASSGKKGPTYEREIFWSAMITVMITIILVLLPSPLDIYCPSEPILSSF